MDEGQSGAAERRVAELREQLRVALAERDRFDVVRKELFTQLQRTVEIQRRAREQHGERLAQAEAQITELGRALAQAQTQIAQLDSFEAPDARAAREEAERLARELQALRAERDDERAQAATLASRLDEETAARAREVALAAALEERLARARTDGERAAEELRRRLVEAERAVAE
ncbi:MAG: hypothetical protein QOG42_1990, partial [Solirubrobacteraceae bacterium]|nr:hypothetical protein [Solirubrobacteraceae bacterium]